MPGVLKFEDKEFWLIPETVSSSNRGQEWRSDVPITSKPRMTAGDKNFIDVGGSPVVGAVPVFEREFWTAAKLLVTVKGFSCYPINEALFGKLPGGFVDILIGQMKVGWRTQEREATFQINWDGILITRKYDVAEFAVGVAAWPRHVLPEWKHFYFIFSLGTAEQQSQQVKPFARPVDAERPAIEPFILFLNDANRLVRSETVISRDEVQAVCRSEMVPRAIGFFDREQPRLCHGLLPIVVSPSDGAISLSRRRAESPKLSSFDALKLPTPTEELERRLVVAVDFGTTNTAVAVSAEDGGSEVLQFSGNTLAVNLTESSGLNPGSWSFSRQGFFPLVTPLSNPLSTLLVEFDDRTFSDSKLLPARCIPGDTLSDTEIWSWAPKSAGHLKQEFKWQDDEAGANYRSAFLEQLGLIVAGELRTNTAYRTRRNVHTVFTCPLSFTNRQMQSLTRAGQAFSESLASCGLRVTTRGSLVSESIANYYLIRNTVKNLGSRSSSERHVVIDIGGGTTDISVFTGQGDPLRLDSLYVGGKDLTETLLSDRLTNHDNSERLVQQLFGKAPTDSSLDARTVQQLLVRRMAKRGGLEAIASSMAEAGLSGTLAEMLILLTFATIYGIRMAALPGTTDSGEVPGAKNIWVWFSGLGSRLFELAPVVKGQLNRREISHRILKTSAAAAVPDATVTFKWRPSNEAKLSVCQGALFVPESADSLALDTLWWADLKATSPPIIWKSPYDQTKAMQLSNGDEETATTEELERCVQSSLESVVKYLNFRLRPEQKKEINNNIPLNYRAALVTIIGDDLGAPSHPVRQVTDGLKESLPDLVREA